MADAVFAAAVEFFLEVGCFVKGNNRIIEFTRPELDEALEAAPSEVLFGEGRDARLAKHRTVEDPSRPLLWASALTSAVSQDMYFPLMETCLLEPLCDMSGGSHLAQIDGVEIGIGDATEYFGATRIAQMLVEARRRVGRPGMPIANQTPCGVQAIGMLGALEYLSPRDGYYVATISELRLDPDRLTKAAILQEWNANIGLLFSTLFAGMAGGPETSAVINVAYWFLGALATKSNYYSAFPLHMMGTNSTHREVMWVVNMSGQAIARNTNFVSFTHIFTRHGPLTKLCIYESVAALLGVMASGYHPSFIGFAGGGKTNRANPLDVRLVAEVALATVGMSRQRANDLCLEFLELYEDKLLPDQDLGKTFPELYDVETRQPLPETVEHYNRMKDELADMGIAFTS
jgi:methylamine--corrinoid protein Co-methyltransferase